MKELTRSKNDQTILLQENNQVREMTREELKKRFLTNKLIRIKKEEYNNIPQTTFAHFNLQTTNHQKGEKYLLAKIERQGSYDGMHEQQPVLSTKNVFLAECSDVQNNLSYDDITTKDFEHSMSHIKNREQLQQTIIQRYEKSMPHLTTKEIIELGVAKTTLKILQRT